MFIKSAQVGQPVINRVIYIYIRIFNHQNCRVTSCPDYPFIGPFMRVVAPYDSIYNSKWENERFSDCSEEITT